MKIFYLPDLGEGLAEAEIREWYVKAGDDVILDQPLVSMETAKAVVDVPSPYAGKIVELHGNINDVIQTGAPLITFDLKDASEDEPKESPKGSVVGSLDESTRTLDEGEVIIGTSTKSTALKVMPAARVLAKQLHVDLSLVKPTGPNGLITPNDVKDFLQADKTEINQEMQTESLYGVRRVMAQVMMQSHQEVVPVTIFEEANITGISKDTDITTLLISAIIAAAKIEPALNAWFDGKSLERKLFNEVHLGLAVDTEQGLFVPVIKNAETLSKDNLRQMINEYKETVKNRTIKPKDLQGATFTLSNFGMIAGRYATPIIIPPTVSILGCGKIRETPLVVNGEVKIGKVLPLSLTFDHRAVTGGEATRFLGAVIKYIENA